MSKWLNKRSQAASEMLSKNTDKTDHGQEFEDLAQQTDATKNAVEKLLKNVPVFLHPNPAARVKMSVGTAVSKMRKIATEKKYPHPVGDLAEHMHKYQDDMSPDNPFAGALRDTSDTLRQINDAANEFDAEVHHNFLEPMKATMDKEIKEVMRHRGKLKSRRLDYDYKRRKRQAGKTSVTDSDVKLAKEKMEESKSLAEAGMYNLLDQSVEQAAQVQAFVQSYLKFFQTGSELLQQLSETLEETMEEAASRPRAERREIPEYEDEPFDGEEDFGDAPCARSCYEFEAENEGELSFPENATIMLTDRLDENWLEGTYEGAKGIFPATYVEVIRDI